MSSADTPLRQMPDALHFDGSAELAPDNSFVETVLPAFKRALVARRSIRVYDGEPMPAPVMRDCLRDATLAPSSSNLQPYELHWVRDEGKKSALAAACLAQPAATTAGELVVVVARADLWRTNLSKLLDIMTDRGTKTLSAPLDSYYRGLLPKVMATDPIGLQNVLRRVVFWFKGRSGPMVRTPVNRGDHRIWAHVQGSLAAQTLMLSLSAHGYDSCPMGGFDAVRVKALLKLPKGAEIVMLISAGRRRPEGLYGPRIRLPESDLIKEV